MVAKSWYLRERGEVRGPYRREELLAMKANGTLNRFHRVSHDRKSWVSISEIDQSDVTISFRPPEQFNVHHSDRPPEPQLAPPSSLVSPILIPFPVGVLLFMHYTTGGLFTLFRITGLHGKLPRLNDDDLSGGQAIGFSLIPFVNVVWWNFIVYAQLCRRINQVRAALHLPGRLPVGFATGIAVCIALSTALCVTWVAVTFLTTAPPGAARDVNRHPLPNGRGATPIERIEELQQLDPTRIAREDPTATLVFLMPGLGLAFVTFALLIPIFAAMVQRGINEIGYAQFRLLQSQSGLS